MRDHVGQESSKRAHRKIQKPPKEEAAGQLAAGDAAGSLVPGPGPWSLVPIGPGPWPLAPGPWSRSRSLVPGPWS
eukprot:2545441-Karenia_brevis.AAC.1